MEVTEYDQIGANWMSGVVPDLGAMWDASTITGTFFSIPVLEVMFGFGIMVLLDGVGM